MVFLLLVALVIGGIYLFRRDRPIEKGPVNTFLVRMVWVLVGLFVLLVVIEGAQK